MRRTVMSLVVLAATLGTLLPGHATGNGAPAGPHYTLNIIGVPKAKSADMTGTSGRSLFVPLNGGCRINLEQGSFEVIDRNCTDGSALFRLPAADPTNSGTTSYSVYARALGKPGGKSTTTTCFTDVTTSETYCSIYQVVLERSTSKSTFTNVTQELLYVYYCDTTTGKLVRVPLFDSSNDSFYWRYDNNGLKLAQLRFYQTPTTVAVAGTDC